MRGQFFLSLSSLTLMQRYCYVRGLALAFPRSGLGSGLLHDDDDDVMRCEP